MPRAQGKCTVETLFISWDLLNTLLPLDPLINTFCICLFLPSPSFLPLPSLTPFLSFAALVQSPLLPRGRGGVAGGEEAGERTAVSLSTVRLSPPSATPVSSVCAFVVVSRLLWHFLSLTVSSCLWFRTCRPRAHDDGCYLNVVVANTEKNFNWNF